MKWCMPDCETSSSFSFSRNHLLMQFRMFKVAYSGVRMFLWEPWALSQSWSGSVLASFCRSKVFTSISEGVWVIWKGLSLPVNFLWSDGLFVLFAALLLWGCFCLADVDKCLELALCPPVTFSVNHRKLKVPGEIFKEDMWTHMLVSAVLSHSERRKPIYSSII